MKKFLFMILLVLVSMMTSANVKQVVVDGITYKLQVKAYQQNSLFPVLWKTGVYSYKSTPIPSLKYCRL